MPAQLPRFLRINDARKHKVVLLASLSPLEVELLDITAMSGGHVFGHRPGKRDPGESHGRVALTYPGRKVSARKWVHDERVLSDGQQVMDRLVRTGWMRFAPIPSDASDTGYFWPTDAAKRLWDLLGRPPKSIWWIKPDTA